MGFCGPEGPEVLASWALRIGEPLLRRSQVEWYAGPEGSVDVPGEPGATYRPNAAGCKPRSYTGRLRVSWRWHEVLRNRWDFYRRGMEAV